MISKLAIADIDALISAGATPTPQQIITLNALGCAINFANPEITSAPRVAPVGNSFLYEFTLQAEQWFCDFAGKWWEKESLVYALAWACANGTKPGFFADFTDEFPALKAITTWYHSLNCTAEQFHAALNYVIRTEDRLIEDEYKKALKPKVAPKEKLFEIPDLDPDSKLEDLTRECLAAGLALTPAQIGTLTGVAVIDILRRWTRLQLARSPGSSDSTARRIRGSAEAKYFRYLEALKNGQQ